MIYLFIFSVADVKYEGKIDSCYFVPTLGSPWIYVKQDKLLEENFKIYLEWS